MNKKTNIYPDPYRNGMDPKHSFKPLIHATYSFRKFWPSMYTDFLLHTYKILY